ncbi:DegT/DnrJ/EryC1/StrS aminotransferase family protein [Parafrankia sp. EUN1f]|uniref:DegT/DnrJ/EryC1/StrS family aminotransferase n=1 Tax=Parafrankia sp. EUN1f TaxID=102897 RepID=UPI0001C4688F|nr:DegT/DnrJ/EryC1/StrS aminotransferase family protein [Parafrankia sp. EUN1f]EFC80624.1 DegT/DnrJ/EryC1/StrS aminotransferase [Parafrankia sp. EUN1f]
MQVPAARIVFSQEDRAEVASVAAEVLTTGAMTLGRQTQQFEAAFAAAHGAPYAVAVNSGTAALEIILRSVDVDGFDVVVPTNTFAATAFAVLRAGGTPIFADVSADTFALSPETVLAAVTPRTKAVVVVHIGGLIPPDIDELRAVLDERGIMLVEDAAHAHGSSLAGRCAGSFGVAGSFSFYPTKLITSGEGGMVVTADERMRDEALVYRDQGKAGFLGNIHIRQGYAWRMSEVHAATGRVHLRHLDRFLGHRRGVAACYDLAIDEMGVDRPRAVDGGVTNYYKYPVLLPLGADRARVKLELRDGHGVSLAGEVYEVPLHRQPVFERFARSGLPVAEDICARHVCLPLHSDMTEAEVEHVVASFRTVVRALELDGAAR